MNLVLCRLRNLWLWNLMMRLCSLSLQRVFLACVQNHPAIASSRLSPGLTLPPPVPVEDPSKRKGGHTKDHPLTQWFMNFSEADELLQLAAAHQQVQAHIAKFRREISLMDVQQQEVNSVSDQ